MSILNGEALRAAPTKNWLLGTPKSLSLSEFQNSNGANMSC